MYKLCTLVLVWDNRYRKEQMPEQTLSGYIRQHLDALVTRMEYGTPQAVIVKELNDLGYSTTLPIFRTLLARARAWRRKKLMTPSVSPEPILTPTQPVQQLIAHDKKSVSKTARLEWQGTMNEEDLI
jgi:hypothetical protein